MNQKEFKYAFEKHRYYILIKSETFKLNNWYSFCLLSNFVYNELYGKKDPIYSQTMKID